MPPADQMRAYAAAQTFVDQQMQPSDLLAIMTFGGGAVRVKQDFTADRGALRDVIQTLIFGDDKDGDGIPDNTDIGTAFGQDDAEFSILNTDRQLSALQTAATMLRALPEQKSLIYFASGLRLNGVDNQAQLRATTNAAIRANVALSPIDARGLVAMAPLGDASRPSPGGIAMFTIAVAQDMERYGVRSNCVAPSGSTRLLPGAGDRVLEPDEYTEYNGRDPGNVGPLVVWLASDLSSGISGQYLRGMSASASSAIVWPFWRSTLPLSSTSLPVVVWPSKSSFTRR